MSSAGSSTTTGSEIGSPDDLQPNSLYGGSSAAYAGEAIFLHSELSPEESEEMMDEYVESGPIAAKCVVERASLRRRENYYFMMGKKSGWGMIAPASTHTTAMTVERHGSSTSSSIGSDAGDAEAAGPVVGGGLRMAAALLDEMFPLGVASQGEMKRGQQCIAADVGFSASGSKEQWHGFVVDDVLYVHVPAFGGSDREFRTAVAALVELAEDTLRCFSVLVALPRTAGDVAAATLVRAFMYSGFELVSPLLYQPSPNYILVGYDAM
ncbi:hypothetical protein EV175_000023 [Coemansia sp. RSA 1933]|nr:hypothetical protein EV175_000023 [Coemansia sp. RSA 1933]